VRPLCDNSAFPFDTSVKGVCQSIAIPYCKEKLEWCGYPTVKKFADSHFNRIATCDRRTDMLRLQHGPLYTSRERGYKMQIKRLPNTKFYMLQRQIYLEMLDKI